MDIYEFTQALWRRRWLLAAGFALLFTFVGALALDFSDGVRLRSNPTYEATIQMAVVPEEFESLAQDLGSQSMAGPANVFATLLSSPQAALEIERQQGVPVLELSVSATGRDRFVTVSALSDSSDAAVVAALGSFHWLEQRLTEPVMMASVPTTTLPPPSLIDDQGKFRGAVVLDLDHAISATTEGLWLVARTDPDDEFAFRLADAAEEPIAEFVATLTPGGAMSLVLEDHVGTPLDTVITNVPTLPEAGAPTYRLVVELDRGLVRGTADDPTLDADRAKARWEPVFAPQQGVPDEISEVSILLLTDVPIPVAIGGRRTPLLVIAFLTAGTIALLIAAVAVDSWIGEHRRRETEDGSVELAADVAKPISLAGQDGTDDQRLLGT